MMLESWIALIALAFLVGGIVFGYAISLIYDNLLLRAHEKLNAERRAYRDLDTLARLQAHLLRDMPGASTIAPQSMKVGSAVATEPKLKAVE